jgi:hypothetical protein
VERDVVVRDGGLGGDLEGDLLEALDVLDLLDERDEQVEPRREHPRELAEPLDDPRLLLRHELHALERQQQQRQQLNE